jgi:RsmE family RNA methyltransferase
LNHNFTFYIEPDGISGNTAVFSPEESHHISGVLRRDTGCEVEAVDGHGIRYRIRLFQKNEHCWEGEILSREKGESSAPMDLRLALPCLKHDQWEVALEAACALGIQGIYLIDFKNAALRWTPPRVTKAKKKAIEALKQSGGSLLTEIAGPFWLRELHTESRNLNVYLADKSGPALSKLTCPALLLIGPEAGFDEEVKGVLRQWNLSRFNLGTRRLRSEVACITALAQAALIISSD